MQIENSFTVPADPETAWNVLLDVPRIAPCMPGAELAEVVGERTYKGNAKLRVGPVSLSFSGTAEITDIDEAARTAKVQARGSDTKGRGGAEAEVLFRLSEDGGQSRVDITTELNLSGSVAQYGRASGLIDAIAGQLVGDFANNLAAEIANDAPGAATPAVGGDEAAPEPDTAPAPAADAPKSDNSISGIRLFFRAVWAMITGKSSGGNR